MRMPGPSKYAFLAAAVIALAAGSGSVARAQQAATLTFTVTENRVPGAAGTGTITPLPNNQFRLDVRLTGMPPNGEHAMHIHTAEGARCDTNAPVTYPLNNVRVDGAGVGTSTTTVTLTADKPVRAGNAYVNVHQGSSVPGPGIICANIDVIFTADGAARAMPVAGGGGPATHPSGAWTIAAITLLALLLGGAGAGAVARRR